MFREFFDVFLHVLVTGLITVLVFLLLGGCDGPRMKLLSLREQGLSPSGVVLRDAETLHNILEAGDLVVRAYVPFEYSTLVFLSPLPLEAP